MAAIFVSHSSKDDVLANALEQWLRSRGFTDLFVDHSNILIGAKWADALRESAGSCRVVICLVTENWLTSAQCPGEFRAAWYMGKRIIPLFYIKDESALNVASRDELRRTRAEAQGLNIAPFIDEAGALDFTRDPTHAGELYAGLMASGAQAAVGLDPEAFHVDRAAHGSPFPGLISFGDDDEDAALFYGRSREIAEALEELRAMRASYDHRPLVVLGASGAGKSSLLKAGIIPRLRREAPAWLCLRAFRPGSDPLLNFADAISRTLADFRAAEAPGNIRRALFEAWTGAERDKSSQLTDAGRESVSRALTIYLDRLRIVATAKDSTLLISVDQAEELARAQGESGDALAAYLRAAMDNPSCKLAFTIRTDNFPELQRNPRFQYLNARGYDLRGLPVFRFNEVVVAPAKRLGISVEAALVDALIADAPKEDALPLLAFTMQRLWNQFAAQGSLKLQDYRDMGGLSGLIEDAAERALAGIGPEQRDSAVIADQIRKADVELAQRTFVPALVEMDDDGTMVRRLERWTTFDEDQQRLLRVFESWRLVVTKASDAESATIEVAHESLFREWSRLRTWLEPERERLETVRGLSVSANAWVKHDKAESFLTHFGPRLLAARALTKQKRFKSQIDAHMRAYMNACSNAALRRASMWLIAFLSAPALAGIAFGTFLLFQVVHAQWLQRQTENQWASSVVSESALAHMAPGHVFHDCPSEAACPRMVVVPAGTFMMGSPPEEVGRYNDEGPQRRIAVPAFAIGVFDVTVANWDACAAGGGCQGYVPSRNGWSGADRPVTNVSWMDAQNYVRWLSSVTGVHYRLLSEAEWEYAARSEPSPDTPSQPWSFGADSSQLPQYAWGSDNAQSMAHAVGQKLPNKFGLYDMYGNVWQWVQDCYQDYEASDTSPAPVERPHCDDRVYRGGSWRSSDPRYFRSANRGENTPTLRDFAHGFRVAREITATP